MKKFLVATVCAGALLSGTAYAADKPVDYTKAVEACSWLVKNKFDPSFVAYVSSVDNTETKMFGTKKSIFMFDFCMDRLGHNLQDNPPN